MEVTACDDPSVTGPCTIVVMGSLHGELEVLQNHLDQLDRIVRLLPAVDFQMVSALVRQAFGGVDDGGLMTKLSELLTLDADGLNQHNRPVKVLSYGDCESVQVRRRLFVALLKQAYFRLINFMFCVMNA